MNTGEKLHKQQQKSEYIPFTNLKYMSTDYATGVPVLTSTTIRFLFTQEKKCHLSLTHTSLYNHLPQASL